MMIVHLGERQTKVQNEVISTCGMKGNVDWLKYCSVLAVNDSFRQSEEEYSVCSQAMN